MLWPPGCHIFLPAGDLQISLVVQAREVAGHEPALAVEGELRRALIIEIAEHQGRPAHTKLTNVALNNFPVLIVLTPELYLHPVGRTAAGGRNRLQQISRTGILERVVLGHAERVLDFHPDIHQSSHGGWRNGRAAS